MTVHRLREILADLDVDAAVLVYDETGVEVEVEKVRVDSLVNGDHILTTAVVLS